MDTVSASSRAACAGEIMASAVNPLASTRPRARENRCMADSVMGALEGARGDSAGDAWSDADPRGGLARAPQIRSG